LERRDAEIFLTLADELHFGRTAERLHVSTARVSQTIKKLERRIGVPLFERTSRRVTLTPVGRRLADELRPAYQRIDAAVDQAVAAGRELRGELHVGFFGPASGRFVLSVAELFQARYPDCDVLIRESQFGDGVDLLRDGGIDILMATFPLRTPDIAVSEVLYHEAKLLAVATRHPYAKRASVTMADLLTAKVLRSPAAVPAIWDATLVPPATPDGREVERGPVFTTTQEMLTLVGAGRGTYPLPAGAAAYHPRPDVAYVLIADAAPYEWGFAWRANEETARVRAFTRAALDRAREDDQPTS
jgi:DNA-binding transcriptional LysR family regulator